MLGNNRRKMPGPATHFKMEISDIGEELEGIVTEPEVIVHGQNRATLIRKAERQLREKHGYQRPIVMTKTPTGKPGNRF